MDGHPTDLTLKKPEPEWVERFLAEFRQLGVVAWAARNAKVSRQYVYQYRAEHPDFAARFKEAQDESTEWLEAAAVRQGVEGNATLLIFLLKSRRPDVYRDNVTVRHSGDPANPVQHEHRGTVSVLAQLDAYADAFESAANREETGDPAGDGDGQPLDSGRG